MVKQPLYTGILVAPAKDVVEIGGRTEQSGRSHEYHQPCVGHTALAVRTETLTVYRPEPDVETLFPESSGEKMCSSC